VRVLPNPFLPTTRSASDCRQRLAPQRYMGSSSLWAPGAASRWPHSWEPRMSRCSPGPEPLGSAPLPSSLQSANVPRYCADLPSYCADFARYRAELPRYCADLPRSEHGDQMSW